MNYENKELCAKCGGDCCKRVPGEARPEDFGGSEKLIKNLTAAFKTRKWAIDWWEGDPRPKNRVKVKDRLDRTYYVRPARKKYAGKDWKICDPAWDGECAFLTKTGCELEHDRRPSTCKLVEPKEKPASMPVHESNCIVHEGGGKEACAKAWIPYQDVLKLMIKKFGSGMELGEHGIGDGDDLFDKLVRDAMAFWKNVRNIGD